MSIVTISSERVLAIHIWPLAGHGWFYHRYVVQDGGTKIAVNIQSSCRCVAASVCIANRWPTCVTTENRQERFAPRYSKPIILLECLDTDGLGDLG